MNVSDIAKEFKTTSDDILKKLKSLKLKAKDSKQELNVAVISVLKSEFNRGGRTVSKTEEKAEASKQTRDGKIKATKEKTVNKKAATQTKTVKTTQAKKTAKGKEKEIKKKTSKIVTRKVKTTLKKKISSKDKARSKFKIGKEPIITLKPLARKRKKHAPSTREGQSADVGSSKLAEQASLATTKFDDRDQLVAQSIQEGLTSSATETDKISQVETESQIIEDESLPAIEIKIPITVKEYSTKIQQKASAVLKQLMMMGVFANINQGLEEDVVRKLTQEFGFRLAKIRTQEEQIIEEHKIEEENPELLTPRAPVVTFMGHVDHGKTTLLDWIRKSKIADSEHGGITQHMGAYSVPHTKGRITFLDTPGHEAFTAMRARGAKITDIVVLVIAADEGIMAQTEEAIDHARAADVPIVVALTKIDRKNADIDRVKKQLSEIELEPEDWGGKTVVVGVSGVTGEGVDSLLELILLEAELLELRANANKKASGIVVEAHLSGGRGAVTTLIVQSGSLMESDVIVVGPFYGKVRAIFDDHNRKIESAGPSRPVEILGLSNVPEAGESFYVVENEKQAKEITFRRQEQLKDQRLHAHQKISLEDLYSQIQEGTIKELNVILKADVRGSLEALKDALNKIPNDKIKLKFIHLGVGDVNTSDVLLAVASNAIIIAFHIGIIPRAKEELEKQPVDVRQYRIIYDAVNDIKKALEGLLEAKIKKNFLARIEVRDVFKLSKSGVVAGCYVTKGKVPRKSLIDVVRDEKVIFSGVISSLKRFKDDVRDVNEGMECGITIEEYNEYQVGDTFEAYEIESIAQKL